MQNVQPMYVGDLYKQLTFYLFIYLNCRHYIYNSTTYSTMRLTRGAQGITVADAYQEFNMLQ